MSTPPRRKKPPAPGLSLTSHQWTNARKEQLAQEVDAQRAIALVLNARKDLRDALLAELFGLQRDVAASDRMFTALLCGRRSGKTIAIVYMIVLALIDAEANEHVVYTAVSHKKAVEILWGYLVEVLRRHGLDRQWTVSDAAHTITTPAGATFWMLGVSEERMIAKVRGNKYRLFVADEVQSYEEHLDSLLNEGVIPALGEARDPLTRRRAGRLILSGTPTGVLSGPWWKVSTGRADSADTPVEDRWDVRTWTMVDNPHIPDAADFMATVRRKNGWTEDDAVYQQEYLARWVRNASILVVPTYATVPPAPTVGVEGWVHWISADYGYSPDPTAVVVIAKRRREPARVVFSWKAHRLDDVAWAEEMKKLVDRFQPVGFTGDNAGSGSRAIDTFNRMFGSQRGVWMRPADKAEKPVRVNALNTDLRRGTLVIENSVETLPLREELDDLVWKDASRKAPHPLCDDHAFDALSYCHMQLFELLESEADAITGLSRTDEEAHEEMLRFMDDVRAARDSEEGVDMWSSIDFVD